jgi:hypothetical protein
MNRMKQKDFARYKKELINTVSKGLLNLYEDPKMLKKVEEFDKWKYGLFSEKEFEWLFDECQKRRDPLYQASYHSSGNRRVTKTHCKEKIQKITHSLNILALLSNAFTDEEWNKVFSYRIFIEFLTMLAYKTGLEYGPPMAKAIEDGVNQYLAENSDGCIQVNVRFSIEPNLERIRRMDESIMAQAVELTLQKLKEEDQE